MLRRFKKCRSLLIAVFVSAPFVLAIAQPEIDLFRFYDAGGDERESFYDIYPRTGGGYYVCGSSEQRAWAARLDEEDNIVWGQLYQASLFRSLIETDDGDIVVCGANGAILAARLNPANGEVRWQRNYVAGSGYAVIELKEGDFIVCGDGLPQGRALGTLIRIEGNGEAVWQRTFGDFGQNRLRSMRETNDGVVAAGFKKNDGEPRLGWLLKLAFDGELQWERQYQFRMEPAGNVYHQTFVSMVRYNGGFAIAGQHYTGEAVGEGADKVGLTLVTENGQIQNQILYPLDQNSSYNTTCIAKLSNGDFAITGYEYYDGQWTHRPIALRTSENGNLRWCKDFNAELEGRDLSSSYNVLNSVIVTEDDVIVACGGLINRGPEAGIDALVVRLESDLLGPQIFVKRPEDSLQTVLCGDSLRFIVRARSREGEEANYLWRCFGNEVGNDTTILVTFPDSLGEFPVSCRFSLDDWANEVGWQVTTKHLLISSYSPDTLSLFLRRGTTQTFTLDTVRAVEGDPVEYQWTLTNLDNFEREETGTEASATVEFLRSGNYQMEGQAYRGESSDNVIWTVAVRSAILDFWPRELSLYVQPDSSGEFGVIPFNPDSDSLSYRWEIDGDSVGGDSTVTLSFAWNDRRIGNPPHLVSAIVMDGAEGDTVRWEVMVREPDEVGKWSSGQEDKWGLLSVSPNPFNSMTTIRYSTSGEAYPTRLTVHDLTGREVVRLVDERAQQSPPSRGGLYAVTFNGKDLPAGIYLLKLEAAGRASARKIVLMK